MVRLWLHATHHDRLGVLHGHEAVATAIARGDQISHATRLQECAVTDGRVQRLREPGIAGTGRRVMDRRGLE
eukprot:365734-Chlamydomonas_euryale.AAC.12